MSDGTSRAISDEALEALLDEHAPFDPVALCPEISAFQTDDLHALREALEALGGEGAGPAYWGLAWPAGAALARVVLDEPGWVRGKRVLDAGTGGGIAAIAAARAGASSVIALDVDPWALRVARLAASRNGVELETLLCDLAVSDPPGPVDVVLEADLQYAPAAKAIRARLAGLAERGATLIVADCGRELFDGAGLELLATVARSRLLGDDGPSAEGEAGRRALLRRHQVASLTPGDAHVYLRRGP